MTDLEKAVEPTETKPATIACYTQSAKFTMIPEPELLRQTKDSTGDWHQFLRSRGFEEGMTFGDRHEFAEPAVQIWNHPSDADLVHISDFNSGYHIWCPTSADTLALLVELGPLIGANAGRQLSQIRDAVDLAFEAWHGHPTHSPCPECSSAERYRREHR